MKLIEQILQPIILVEDKYFFYRLIIRVMAIITIGTIITYIVKELTIENDRRTNK